MGLKLTDEFRKDAVRIALTGGLTRRQVADDLGAPSPASTHQFLQYRFRFGAEQDRPNDVDGLAHLAEVGFSARCGAPVSIVCSHAHWYNALTAISCLCWVMLVISNCC